MTKACSFEDFTAPFMPRAAPWAQPQKTRCADAQLVGHAVPTTEAVTALAQHCAEAWPIPPMLKGPTNDTDDLLMQDMAEHIPWCA